MPENPGDEAFCAVIVNYRRYDLLADCITSLLASSTPPAEIIVVDNESDARSLATFATAFPSVCTIANLANAGYSRACNQGWRAAHHESVLFLNPDVTPDPGCLAACLRALRSSESIGVVTCRLMRPDGRLDHACHRGLPTPLAAASYALRLHRLLPRVRRLSRYTMSWLDPLTDHDVEACSGAFMLVRRSDLERLGGWDERYWFYGEDLDLCVRIGHLGKRVRYLGTATATHIKGASSGLHGPGLTRDDAARGRTRRLRAAIIDSHELFFRDHLLPATSRPVAAAIRASFAAQRLRLTLTNRLDALRPR